jgi:hypothetical protein
MTHEEFKNYIGVLQQKPFAIYPMPEGFDDISNKWEYREASTTHAIIFNIAKDKASLVPIVLVEFVNPGVLRLSRRVTPLNGSFV